MNYFDNYKLVHFLQQHGVKVLEVSPRSITVCTMATFETRPLCMKETIYASMPDVRDYLGY